MDGPPPQEEDFSQLPVSDRLAHKNWKARVSGYETLVKTFQNTTADTDPAFKPYLSNPDILKKIVTDTNAVAQEKGVEAVVSFVKYAGETAAKTREVVVPSLVDKCLGSTRASTKTHATELCLQYVEVENEGAGVVGDILPGLAAKQPKVVAGCVFVLRELVRLFDTHIIPPPPLLKALPKIFAHTDKTVRAEGNALAHVLYRGIGSAIEPWLAELKPVQVKELHEVFEKMDSEGIGKGTLKPERLTRAQAQEFEAGTGAEEVEAAQEDLTPPDPRAFAEPVDIVPRLPSGLQTSLMSPKWKERKEVLDDLAIVINSALRIKDSVELADVAKGLAGRMTDANISCVIAAAICIEALAKGLLDAFAKYREVVIPPMLERLKERKPNVTDAIGLALDAVFATTNLPDIIPDILPPLSSKNPQVKEGTMKFLARCLSVTTIPPAQGQVKTLSEALAGLLEDSSEGTRNEAAICLGTLMKIIGERPLNAIMDQLADVRKAKVKEAHEKATVKCKVGASGPPKGPPVSLKAAPLVKPPPAKAAMTKTPLTEKVNQASLSVSEEPADSMGPAKVKPPARSLAKKPPVVDALSEEPSLPAVVKPAAKAQTRLMQAKKPLATTIAIPAAKGGKASIPTAPSTLDAFKYKHAPEDADAMVMELVPTSIAADFSDPNWKIRLAALEEMVAWLEGIVADIESEILVRFLIKKGSNEKNFQVSVKLYGILATLAEQCPSFGRSSVALATPHLSEKLGDVKLKKSAGDTMMIFAEKTSLQFVLNQAYETLSKQKAPKVLADSLTWIDTALTEFGVAGLSLRTLIDFLKTALGNSNAAVRTSATKTLVTVKIFVGPGVKDLLGDLNPQLLGTIQSEFDKVDGAAAPQPTRISADFAIAGPQSDSRKAGTVATPDPLDDLFPRVELDDLLRGTSILADAKNDTWKIKKEALEALQTILDQGSSKRLKPHMGEIGQILKARVTDTNKAVQLLALDVVGRIAIGMGKPFEKQTRFFALPVATVLADQKANIRAAGVQTLILIATACEGVDSMVHGLTTALESSNPVQRASLLNWIADWFREHEATPSLDLSSWVGPVINCLDDRNVDVRKAAQAVLPFIVAQAGFDCVMQQTSSLKPASRNTIVPMVKAAKPANPNVGKTKPAASIQASTTVSPAPDVVVPVTTASSLSPPSPPQSAAPIKVPVSKLAGVRRKLPQGSVPRPESRSSLHEDVAPSRLPGKSTLGALKRPGSVLANAPGRTAVSSSPTLSLLSPFSGSSMDTKKVRLARDGARWVVESGPVRKDLIDALQHQFEPVTSQEVLSLLFSRDHNAVNDYISGLGLLCDFYSSLASEDDRHSASMEKRTAAGIAHTDLCFKYVSVRIHEPQPNLIAKCLDLIENLTAFLRETNNQLTDPEAMCFIPTIINKLGDAREAVRVRVQQVIQTLPKIYAYSRIFQVLLDYGLKSKVAKTRQGALDELAIIIKRTGVSACEPLKAFPLIGSMLSDKDAQVRKAALSALSEAYTLVGDKIWQLVGSLSPKDKTQLEERLRRVAGPSTPPKDDPPTSPSVAASRIGSLAARSASPAPSSRFTSIRPASPALVGPTPGRTVVSGLPMAAIATGSSETGRPVSPVRVSKIPMAGDVIPSSPIPGARPKSFLPSRLGPARFKPNYQPSAFSAPTSAIEDAFIEDRPDERTLRTASPEVPALPTQKQESDEKSISLIISKILSSDATRSVEALKEIQRVLEIGPEQGPSSALYRELSDHTEGLIDTITLQMGHIFETPSTLAEPEGFRLAKHLIQTLNAFCDHALLAESLQVDILTALLEELTLRLLQTDESPNVKVKDLSRFINMIILRLFATCRRMTVIRSLFMLLLQIVKPFPINGTPNEAKEAKVAELVLKCIWKLARNLPEDLEKQELDPVELFPAIEQFLQSIPPNEWRARATNKVPSGDMPLRTIKVIIQHVVAHYGDDVYDVLSSSFDDPSATIVYPYVYRILNTSRETGRNGATKTGDTQAEADPVMARPISPPATSSSASNERHHSGLSHRTSRSATSMNGVGLFSPPVEEPDPDDQLLTIINHISSETTGAMHKEGITELHHFLKAYPHKKPRVDKMLESTGPAFRKYIARALASRAAEDEERNVAVADTLSKLESKAVPSSPDLPIESSPHSPRRSSATSDTTPADNEKLSRLHDLFHYRVSSTSNGSSSQGARANSVVSSTRGAI